METSGSLSLLAPILIGPPCLMAALPLSFFCYYKVFYFLDLQLAVLLFLALFLAVLSFCSRYCSSAPFSGAGESTGG